jgi:flagellar hook assembly protein FlgD
MDVTVQIFTTSGQLVKTLDEFNIFSEGNRVTGIEWDGKSDSFGDLAQGIYFYRVEIALSTGNDGSKAVSNFERLVLLK